MIPEGHKWEKFKTTEYSGSVWTFYVCADCGASLQIEHFESVDPCHEHEAVSPNIGTAA